MKRLALILCLLLSLPLGAMEGRFVNYGSADGLPSGSVYAITQDSEGFLWVGTRNGLCRFDGAHFKVWKECGRVNALAMDKDDRLWVGTMDGLLVMDEDKLVHGGEGNIRALLADSEGFVWATVGDTLLRKLSWRDGVKDIARARYDKRFHEGDYPYFQIYEDHSGRLCLAGRLVRAQYVDDRENPQPKYFFEDLRCFGSYAEAGGILYTVNDHTNELCTLEGKLCTVIGRLPVAHARLLTDSKGRLWAAGSYGLALVRTEKPEDTQVMKTPSTELYCIFEDRMGNIWVGGDNGLSALCPSLQQVHTLTKENITALMQTREGEMWYGTAGERASCLYQDRDGTIYKGLWNNTGFEVWKGGRMHKERLRGPLPQKQRSVAEHLDGANWISDFLEDSRGRFWVVSWEGVGLNEWDRSRGTSLPPRWLSPFLYPTPQLDSNIYVSSRLGSRLIEDTEGNLVYATTHAGLNIIDMDTDLVTKYYRGNSSIPDDYVTDLCLSPDGTVWAATRGGIWSPSGRHFLDGMLVQSIEADASGRLWAGTEEGLWFIDTDGSAGRVGKGLGLPSDIYGEKVSCTMADGSLAFGGALGAACFHPDSLLERASAPELFITEFSTAEAGVHFSFSVKDLPLASLLQYRYRISGTDQDWISAEYPRLQGRYNGLFPGRYTLEIQRTDIFGRWQEDTLRRSFRLRAPLLLRWPFMLLYILLLGGAAWLFVRYRENRQRAKVLQEELDTRNRFFGIISHDLRNPVSGMNSLAQALENAPEGAMREGIKEIGAAARHTSALLENLLMWSVMQKGVLRPVMREVMLSDIVDAASGGRSISVEIPEGLMVHTDPNMLTTCIRNLLDNALRYSPDYVRLTAEPSKIVITDHGPGMDEETLRTLSRPGHLGLAITRELLEKMGASMEARNLPDGGLEITLTL